MTRHRFGRTDGNFAGSFTENLLDGERLKFVVVRRRSAMRVNVIHLFGRDTTTRQRAAHRQRQTFPLRIRGGDVVRVTRRSIAGELTINPRTTRLRVLQRFQDQNT